MWGQGVYGAQILVWVHKFAFKLVLGVIFSHRLLLLLNIQIEKSLIRILFEYSNTIEWQYKKQVTNTKEWQFWPPIFKASATPDCSVLFMHSLFFPFCGKLGLESCINPRDYSDVTYMPVFGNMAISCYHDSPFSNSPWPDPIRLVCSNATQIFLKVNLKKKLNVCAELSAKPPQNLFGQIVYSY